MKRPDPLLRTQPWKVMAVLSPIEGILKRLESDGTVDAIGRQIVFTESSSGERFDLPEAIRGVVDFHELAASKYGLPIDVDALRRFANKLHAGSPIFEADVEASRRCLQACWSQAMQLRVSQAADLVRTVQIGAEIEKIGRAA